jgi:hypothetical protein
LQAKLGEAEHVDQPAGSAGDASLKEQPVDLFVGRRAGVAEEVLADLEKQSELFSIVRDVVGDHADRGSAACSMAAVRVRARR